MDTNPNDPMDQTDVIRFLEGGAGSATPATRIDTHGALIFLIGDKAYKVKRAVKYDYMDLSTVKKRHDLLDREYALNQPTVPSIYDAVVPIVRRRDGSLALGGDGTAVEWVLVMHRFAPTAELINIAQQQGISDDLAQALGTAIARYHSAAPVRDIDAATLILEILDELGRVFGSISGDTAREGKAYVEQARTVWSNSQNALLQRSKGGHIRRCHGDLHLRNIVLIDGVPTPFDALEFDERLGTCDTLYDLAFLIMDLDHLGMRHAANLVLNAYLTATVEGFGNAGLSLLPLYLFIRAAIRAMVDLQTMQVANNRSGLRQDATVYLRQACAYLDPPKPSLVAIGGFSGTGKTTVARAVAHLIGAAPGAVHIRSDVLRKTLLHHDPMAPLPAAGYTPEITAQTYAAMRAQAAGVLAQGHSVLLDAVHSDPADRQAAQDLAENSGFAFLGIWLTSSTKTRLSRVSSRGPDASDADADVVRKQAVVDPGPVGWHHIDTDRSVNATVQSVTTLLAAFADKGAPIGGGTHVG